MGSFSEVARHLLKLYNINQIITVYDAAILHYVQ